MCAGRTLRHHADHISRRIIPLRRLLNLTNTLARLLDTVVWCGLGTDDELYCGYGSMGSIIIIGSSSGDGAHGRGRGSVAVYEL